MKGFFVLFFNKKKKKCQESCFSGTSGNSGGDGEANSIPRGMGSWKTAGDLGERVPSGIPSYHWVWFQLRTQYTHSLRLNNCLTYKKRLMNVPLLRNGSLEIRNAQKMKIDFWERNFFNNFLKNLAWNSLLALENPCVFSLYFTLKMIHTISLSMQKCGHYNFNKIWATFLPIKSWKE